MATHKGIVVHQYGKPPVYENFVKPVPAEGQFLIQVQASTVNPSDRMRVGGHYFPVPLPATMGLQGTGKVIEANGANIQDWVGKRVCFLSEGCGTWGEYSVSSPARSFIIDGQVPLHSAASGIVNPLTVIGMTELYEQHPGKKGIIHTAAASSLGRMLNKRCISLGIPLLNIVRKQQHADLLISEGAKHVIITKGEWQKEYATAISEHGFNVLFDALGGGPITQSLILGMNAGSIARVYGYLESKPLSFNIGLQLSKGIMVTGYMVFTWYVTISEERRKYIHDHYSEWLKNDLATHSLKYLKFSEIGQALELSVSKATEGKITLVPN